MPIIATTSLTKRYGSHTGVNQISLNIDEGAIFGFLGPNGSGKTTTIRLLLGFLRPSEGSATVFGKDAWKHSHLIKRDVGYLPGDLRLYPWMTTRNAITFVARTRKMNLAAAGSELAERFNLDPTIPVRRMSRGTRQKLGLLLALVHKPRLLILDEPTTGLDPIIQDRLTSLLRERASQGHSIFFSSHTLREVEHLCSRVAIVRDGQIVADETIESLRGRALRQVAIQFEKNSDQSTIEPPAFMQSVERSGDSWQCSLQGPADQLIQWAAKMPIHDMTISQPDLETVFRAYYTATNDAAESVAKEETNN